MRTLAATLATTVALGLSPARAADRPATDLAGLLGLDRIEPHEVTLALRDLVRTLPTLSGPEARLANRMLMRPTDGGVDPEGNGYPDTGSWTYVCATVFCYHWVSAGDDAVAPIDANVNSVPDQVDLTQQVMDEVYDTEVTTFGFRPPKDDSSSVLPFAAGNPDGRFDIYLANIDEDGLYGYCSTDDPESNLNNRSDVSAYCVLDNDYSLFPDPVAALQVTGAHEFFHAVQYAYSYLSDGWFLESLAAWIEDEVYTDVNDNLQYLSGSPISIRGLPIDDGSVNVIYGSWIWWEFLSTTLGESEARELIRDMFERTEFPASDGLFAHAAMRASFSEAALDLGRFMAWFGIANATPATSYPEGAVNSYPSTGFAASATLRSDSATASRTVTLDHLASKAVRLRPGAGMLAGAKVRVVIDLPRAASSPGGIVLVRFLDGSTLLRTPTFNGDGIGTLRLQFNRNTVRDVLVGLGNGSTRFDCFEGTPYSCEGAPLDDALRTSVRATPLP